MNYAAIQAKANAKLMQHGMAAKITRQGTSVGSGYVVRAESKKTWDPMLRAQTVSSDVTYLLSGSTKAPQVGDVLSTDKGAWTIVEVETIRPTTTTLLYELRVQ